jgi:hypothetical protein
MRKATRVRLAEEQASYASMAKSVYSQERLIRSRMNATR